ncbi:MAG: hypothetical protein GC192_04675 [Bacteroidetes bacterium]|nr:hypothetical protein [Bacteroidota bacterium]
MKAVKIQALLLYLMVFFTAATAQEQVAGIPTPLSAYEAIQTLKNGTLVIRLATNVRRIEALEKMVATTSKEKDRQRFENMLQKTKQETEDKNRWLMAAFQANYTFSKLLFMPDTASTLLKTGTRKGIFYGSDLKIEPSLSLDGDFLVAYNGPSASRDNSANEGINVLDGNLQLLQSPFPYFVGRTSVRRMFEETFNKTTELDHYNTLVKKFQQRLEEFGGQ